MYRIFDLKIRDERRKIIMTLINVLGITLFFPYSIVFRQSSNIVFNSIKNILVIQIAGIGDSVMSVPILRILRENLPDASITLVTSKNGKEILKNCPYYDEMFSCEHIIDRKKNNIIDFIRLLKLLRSKKFDLAIDIKGDFFAILLMFLTGAKYRAGYDITGGGFLLTHVIPYKNGKHEVEHYLDVARFFGLNIVNKNLELWPTEKDKNMVINFLKKNNIKKSDILIGIHPGARWHYRQWNKKKFAQLSDLISKTYGNVKIIFLQDIENNLTNEIIAMAELKPLSIKLSIGQMISFFEICDIFIGNDSGPAHLAAAIKKPAIVLFGPEDPVRFSPYGANCIVIHKKLPCNPCNQVKCIRPKNSCMDLITVDEVLKEIGKTINKIKFGKCSYLIA